MSGARNYFSKGPPLRFWSKLNHQKNETAGRGSINAQKMTGQQPKDAKETARKHRRRRKRLAKNEPSKPEPVKNLGENNPPRRVKPSY